ncbi:MAG: hypothetical protein IPH28_25385 [Cytophagaceae bacterium]|nr:hypothetical protein [Cytophagaceae bacterium]
MRKIIIVLFGLYFGFSSREFFTNKNYKRGLSSMESGNFDIAIKEFLKVKDIDSSQSWGFESQNRRFLSFVKPLDRSSSLL